MIKKKDIVNRMNNFSIVYEGYNISNEDFTKMYIDYIAGTYSNKHNVSYVFEVDSLLFRIVTIAMS